ncbi:MAG: hypothetical protein WBS24_05520 [Terriglobales bacterium]
MARKAPALLFAVALSTVALSAFAAAEGTRTWEQSNFDDLIKGTGTGIAFPSEGGLELAPAFKSLATLHSTYIWSIASDAAGNIFAAAGAPARVYRITPDGKSAPIFEPQELQVQSLAVAKDGTVYAATSPDGKVYRLTAKGEAESGKALNGWTASIYFDPAAKYIWDLALDHSGNLYVATGDHGEIYKVGATGQHSLFFKSDEVHIRVLALDPKGNLIAGSDGSGLIYRIGPNGDAFVLYSAPKKEITALAIDGAGNIYAAGAGEKHSGAGSSPGVNISAAAPASPAASMGGLTISAAPSPAGSTAPFPAPGAGATGGSEIYRISPDGAPQHLWTSHDDLVYALGFDRQGRLLAGTGNRGHIFAINGPDNYTDLVNAAASQITAFAPAPGGGLYVSSSNLGKIFELGPGSDSEGSYESDVFDAHGFSRWGRGGMRSTGNVELFARSGNVDNPDRNWSPWTRVDSAANSELKVPPARFVQWRAVLHAGSTAPRVENVLLYYLPKNVAPVVDEITVQPGYHYQSSPRPQNADSQSPGQPHFEPPPPAIRDRDSIGIRWQAHDDNEDELVFSVYYRADGESRWSLLKDDISDRYYAFDASLLPDGGYTVMVVASDAPSHSPGEALYAQKVSARFEVDNSAPVIENLTAAIEGKQIRVRFRARDSFSTIKRAEFSLDGGEWQFVDPAGQLSDAKSEDYDFRVETPEMEPAPPLIASSVGGGHVIVVRAYDRFDNLATARTVVNDK